MIVIQFKQDGLKVSGHATAGEGGEFSKVCGAVTLLAYLYAAAVTDAAEEGEAMVLRFVVEPGDVDIAFDGEVSGLWLLRHGVKLLTEQYPQFVREVQA